MWAWTANWQWLFMRMAPGSLLPRWLLNWSLHLFMRFATVMNIYQPGFSIWSVVVAQKRAVRSCVKALLICSALLNGTTYHGGSVFLFPVAGVWSNKELYVAVAEQLALCSQVQRDQGLAAPLALHRPVPTQQVTAETCPEVHGDTSERDTGPGVQSEDSDSDEVSDLAYNQPKAFKNNAKKSHGLKYWDYYFPSSLYIFSFKLSLFFILSWTLNH